MPRTVSGTSYTHYQDHDLIVTWVITRGRDAALNAPAEADEIDVTSIMVDQGETTAPCPDDLHDAFVADQSALQSLMADAIEEAIRQKEEAFDLSM